jgi:hypothetical protein
MSQSTRPGSPEFYKILEEAANLHELKNQDYATQDDPLANFKRVARMCDKLLNPAIPEKLRWVAISIIYKAKQFDAEIELLGENKAAKVEGLIPRMMDQLVYSGLEIVLTKEAGKE